MASDLDLAGRIILEDAFSVPLETLAAKAKVGEDALEGLGRGADTSVKSAAARIAELTTQLEQLRTKGAAGPLDVADVNAYRGATSELGSIKGVLAEISGEATKVAPAFAPLAQAGGKAGALQAALSQLNLTGGATSEVMSALGLNVARFAGPAGLGLAVAGAAKLAFELGVMGMESTQVEARFTAFAGGAARAQGYLAGMDTALGNALTQDQKMGAVSRITSLELAKTGDAAANVAKAAVILGDAHTSATARIEQFTQMLVSGQTRGLAAYGISMQEVKQRAEELRYANEGLSSSEATAAAIMEVANRKVKDVIAAGGGASTAIEDFRNAWEDLKDATGSKIQPVVEPIIKTATTVVQGATHVTNGPTAEELAQNSVARATDSVTLANERLAYSLAELQAARQRAAAEPQNDLLQQAAAQAEQAVAAQRQYLADQQYILAQVRGQQKGVQEDQLGTKFLEDYNAALGVTTAAQQAQTDALTAYNQVVQDTRDKLSGLQAQAQQLGQAAGAFKGLAAAGPPMPDLPKNLAFDTGPYQTYLAIMGQMANSPERQKMLDDNRTAVEDFQRQQQAIINTARAMQDGQAGVAYLAQGLLGNAKAQGQDLIAVFDQLPANARRAFTEMGGATVAYDAALAQAAAGARSLATTWDALVNVGTSLRTVTANAGQLAMPEMPKNLNYDPAPLRAYLDALQATDPAAAALVQRTREQVAAFESAQQGVIAHALSLDTESARLTALAQAFLGPQAGVGDLVTSFASLPPAVQAAINPVELLSASIARLQQQASAPITVDVSVQGLQSGLSEIDTLALKLTGVLSPEQVRQFRDRTGAEFTQFWQSIGTTDTFGMQQQKAAWLQHYEDLVGGALSYYKKSEQDYKVHIEGIAASAQELRSKVENALNLGTDVTDADMLAAGAGVYKEKANESVRQLDDIAQHGREALSRHKDWIDKFQIPAPLMASGLDAEKQLKAWAAGQREEVKNLQRPDLLNMDAFGQQWDQMQKAADTKEFTLNTAVTFLDKTGRLKGKSKEEASKEIAKMLGMADPEMKIDTLFAVADPNKQQADVLNTFLQGKTAIEIPAKLVPVGPYNPADFGINPADLPGGQRQPAPAATGAASATGQPMGGAARAQYELDQVASGLSGGSQNPALATAGDGVAATFLAGFNAKLAAARVAADVASALGADFAKNGALFTAVGTSAGTQVGVAFTQAVLDGAGDVVGALARRVAPEVEAIINAKRKGKGSLP
jgi:hypothetical protein